MNRFSFCEGHVKGNPVCLQWRKIVLGTESSGCDVNSNIYNTLSMELQAYEKDE